MTIIQPALPHYRRPVFERMSKRFGPSFVVYASPSIEPEVVAARADLATWERYLGPLRRLGAGLEWQSGAMSVPIARDDIVVICGAPRTISTLLIIAKCRLRGAHSIWWGHYWSATSKPWRAAIRTALMHTANAIAFYTDQEVSEFRSSQGRGEDQLVFGLNNGIEIEEITHLRAPYLADERALDLLFVGRLTPKSELELLLSALALPPCSGIRLDVIGDGEAKAKLQRQCFELGISDRVTWHGAVTEEARIAEVANKCKAFVYPGAVGLSLIHGLAYGLPAIVHDDRWTHMPEIAALKAGANGVTFRKGMAHDLASVIATLIADPRRLEAMSKNAIITTKDSYNAADMANRFCAAVTTVHSLLAGS